MDHIISLILTVFLSTPSVRRATRQITYTLPRFKFLSTPSVRRATVTIVTRTATIVISIHALRTEGDHRKVHWYTENLISIHALRTEGDGEFAMVNDDGHIISIHALRTEGDVIGATSKDTFS